MLSAAGGHGRGDKQAIRARVSYACWYQVVGVVVGEGYRFGYRAAGDTATLQSLGAAAGLRVVVADLIDAGVPGLVGKVRHTQFVRISGRGCPEFVCKGPAV